MIFPLLFRQLFKNTPILEPFLKQTTSLQYMKYEEMVETSVQKSSNKPRNIWVKGKF